MKNKFLNVLVGLFVVGVFVTVVFGLLQYNKTHDANNKSAQPAATAAANPGDCTMQAGNLKLIIKKVSHFDNAPAYNATVQNTDAHDQHVFHVDTGTEYHGTLDPGATSKVYPIVGTTTVTVWETSKSNARKLAVSASC